MHSHAGAWERVVNAVDKHGEYVELKKNGVFILRYLYKILLICLLLSTNELVSKETSFEYPENYPRLATLWNHGNVNEKARFDLIVEPIERIWPVQDVNELTMAQVRKLNPNILMLGYYHSTNILMEMYFGNDFFDHQIVDYCWVLTHAGLHEGYGGTEITGDGISETDLKIPVSENEVFSPNQFLLIQNFDTGYEMVQVAPDWQSDQEQNIVRVRERGIYDQWGEFPAIAHPAGTRIASIALPFSGTYGKARAELNCTQYCRKSEQTGETWVEFFCRDVTRKMKSDALDDLFDGVFLDNAGRHAVSSNRYDIAITEEAERANRSDYTNEEWIKGIFHLYELLKSMMPEKAILANKGYEGYGRIDGAMMEHYHFDYANRTMVECHYDNWYRFEKNNDRPLNSSGLFIFNGGGEKQDKDYHAMRFALTRCLMRDGYFLFDDTVQGHHQKMWWFDEFDNCGQGKGYLGRPTGEMQHLISAKETDAVNAFDMSILSKSKSGDAFVYQPGDTPKQWSIPTNVVKEPCLTIYFEFKGNANDIFSVEIPGAKLFIDQLKCEPEWQSFQFSFDADRLTNPDCIFDFSKVDHQLMIRNLKLIPADMRLYRRNFENGIVLHNGTDQSRTVSLEKRYQKIKGRQDPLYNTGEIIEKAELQTKDGIILLNINQQ